MRHQDGRQQHGVRLGQPRLDAEQHRGRHQQAGEQRHARTPEGHRQPPGQAGGENRTDHRRQAIDTDRRVRSRASRPDSDRLQPVDADRLLVAGFFLQSDIEVVAGLDHLVRRLREARLVAVDRRQRGEAWQEGEQGHDRDQGKARRRRSRDPVHRPFDPRRETRPDRVRPACGRLGPAHALTVPSTFVPEASGI